MVSLRERRLQFAWVIGLVIGLGSATGCVERRYTIRSNPPGALAIVNNEEIGPTPVSRSFIFYGDREITLMLDGYETQTIIQPIDAPWWDNFFTEFITENMIPYTFRDEREFVYQMSPPQIPPKTDLLSRAESLRAVGVSPPPPRAKWLREYIRGWLGYDDD